MKGYMGLFINGVIFFIVAAGVLVSCTGEKGVTIQDFEGSGGALFKGVKLGTGSPPEIINEDASASSSYLQLQSGKTFGESNGVGFDLSSRGVSNHIVADFDFRITCMGSRTGFSGGGCADGFSFLLLDASKHGNSGAPAVTQGETGALKNGAQFALGFNTFYNIGSPSDGGSGNSVSLLFNNKFIHGSAKPISFDLATGTQGKKGKFHHAHIDLLLGEKPNVSVKLTSGVTGKTIASYSKFDLSSVVEMKAAKWRVGFASRCGDACSEVDIDNVNVSFSRE